MPIQGFQTARKVTFPLSKWKNDEPKYLKFETAIFQGKEIKQKNTEVHEEPADLANVIDLETGEDVQIIVGAVLKATLEEEYGEKGYVGKYFEIIQHRDSGKKYNTYSITELMPQNNSDAPPQAEKPKK